MLSYSVFPRLFRLIVFPTSCSGCREVGSSTVLPIPAITSLITLLSSFFPFPDGRGISRWIRPSVTRSFTFKTTSSFFRDRREYQRAFTISVYSFPWSLVLFLSWSNPLRWCVGYFNSIVSVSSPSPLSCVWGVGVVASFIPGLGGETFKSSRALSIFVGTSPKPPSFCSFLLIGPAPV
ncbi:MAG: hypothetical protein DDT33_01810 [Firmicutes bacterium]|nr:hypothetical protein [Bacillota bacterium]